MAVDRRGVGVAEGGLNDPPRVDLEDTGDVVVRARWRVDQRRDLVDSLLIRRGRVDIAGGRTGPRVVSARRVVLDALGQFFDDLVDGDGERAARRSSAINRAVRVDAVERVARQPRLGKPAACAKLCQVVLAGACAQNRRRAQPQVGADGVSLLEYRPAGSSPTGDLCRIRELCHGTQYLKYG